MQLMLNVTCISGVTNTVPIPTIQYERIDNTNTLMRRQFLLLLYWVYTFRKSQGNTLDLAILYLEESETCSGTTLVALSCVRKLSHLIICPILL